jgi:hypothetical protein
MKAWALVIGIRISGLRKLIAGCGRWQSCDDGRKAQQPLLPPDPGASDHAGSLSDSRAGNHQCDGDSYQC